MQLNTRHFGEIEIDENKVITFEEGIPSFENVKKYIILGNMEEDSPFRWLQSVDEPNLAFALVIPFMIKKDYDFSISEETVAQLGIKEQKDVEVYSIVVVPEDVSRMTMNLKAPVIINVKSRKGLQVILDTDKYGVRHYILDELRRQEVAQDACSNKEEGAVHRNK